MKVARTERGSWGSALSSSKTASQTQVDMDDWRGGAGREGSEVIAIASMRFSTARIVPTFSCMVLGMDVLSRT